jgi:hypothetical protein
MMYQDPLLYGVDVRLSTLWIGALLTAGADEVDAFPDDLNGLAEEYFSLFPPVAKA